MQAFLILIIAAGVPFLGCHYDQGFLKPEFLPGPLGGLKLSTYGIMMALGFLTANFILHKEFTRLNLPIKMADNLIIIIAIGGILGAKVFYIWETSAQWSGWAGFVDRFFSGGGLTWYGGFIVASLFSYFYLRKNNIPFLRMADIGTPSMALGYFFGRMGCLVSGDGCYGEVCPYDWPAPFAMAFPNGAAVSSWNQIVSEHGPDAVVYNTPFYEGFFSLLLFAYFQRTRMKEWPLGTKFFTFVILHSVSRFFVEFIRLNPRDVFGVTQAQFISLTLIVVSIAYIAYRRREIAQGLQGK